MLFERWRPAGGTEFVEKYTQGFPSAVTTEYPENDQVRLDVYLPTNRIGPVPVVVTLHYWGATDANYEAELAHEMATRGIATIVMPLPYHLWRTPKGHRSGELAIRPDPNALMQNMSQAVSDVRRTLDWIGTRPEFRQDAIGLNGISLGAVVSTLAFSQDHRIRAGSFVLGGVDLAGIIWRSSRVIPQREELRSKGFTEASLREALAPVEPENRLDPTDTRPTFVISARHDTVVPASSTEKMLARLGNVHQIALETGHYGGFLVRRQIIRHVVTFFESSLLGRELDLPSGLRSPTLRILCGADPESGLQIGVGLDVWRLNSGSDTFATLLATPRGMRLYIGTSLGQGISVGAMASPHKTSPALVWSRVF